MKVITLFIFFIFSFQNSYAFKFDSGLIIVDEIDRADSVLNPSLQEILKQIESDGKADAMESNIEVTGYGSVSMEEAIEIHKVNGVSFAIVEDGKVTQHRYYGYRDKQKTLPTNKQTKYQAASMTKFVASLGIIEAERLGYLQLGKGMTYYANEYPGSIVDDWIDKKFKKDEEDYPGQITLRRLLSHTAGLDVHGIGTQLPGLEKTMEGIILGNIWDPFNNGVQPIASPGTIWDYSGGGYTVAEHILELTTNDSAKDFFTDHFLDELDMSKSTFNEASNLYGADDENLARGCSRSLCAYDVMNTKVKAAGGLITTVDDYAKILVAVQNDGKDESGNQVLNYNNIVEAMTPMHHRDSSLNYCEKDSDCPDSYEICIPGFCFDYPVEETCFLNKCKILIKDGNAYYAKGTYVNDNILSDGLPSVIYHGGSQTGFSSYFYLSRMNAKGIVIMVNGDRSWKKNGTKYGGGKFKDQIFDAFVREYLDN